MNGEKREIIGGWTISQNQPTKRRTLHRQPIATTDEGLPQPSELSLGPLGATRCDLWWARYLPPLDSRLSHTASIAESVQASTKSAASQSRASSRAFKISSSRREKLFSSSQEALQFVTKRGEEVLCSYQGRLLNKGLVENLALFAY